MNHIYRTVWSEITHTFVATAEFVKGKGKATKSSKAGESSEAALASSALLADIHDAQAPPQPLKKVMRSLAMPLALEQRFMFDGAAADVGHALPDATALAALPEVVAPVQIRAADPSLNQGKKEVVFVDTAVADYKTLEAGIKDGVEIVEIAANQSGLAQIAQWAQNRQGYDSIQILSHGSTGTLNLGTDGINHAQLSNATVQTELALLGHALKADGDLMIYGCDIAQGESGQQFIADLALATGADIAASNDATGSAAKGGDWNLEVRQGDINSEIPIDSVTLNSPS